jgi:hypothetical protein
LSNDKTFFLPAADPWLIATLNSPLMWWHNWRHLTHLKDEALSPMAYKMEVVPIVQPDTKTREAAANAVKALVSSTREASSAASALMDWLRHEFEIEKPTRELSNVAALDIDSFITAVRDALPKKRKFTAVEITALKREHGRIIEPARILRSEILLHERKLSDLVNNAYGLTPQDIALMWASAPPRMPLSPSGEAVSPDIEDDNGDDEA